MKQTSQEKATYQIRLKGHLPDNWSDWFDGFTIDNQPTGETVLTGEIVDQTALYSLLQRIRDLGLTLIEVKRLDNSHENNESN
jgi:hypothetical protein